MEAMFSFFLPRLIKALHVTSTSATYPPDHKLHEELFSEVLDKPEQALPRAIKIAEDVANNCSNFSLMLMKEIIWRNPDRPRQHVFSIRKVCGNFTDLR